MGSVDSFTLTSQEAVALTHKAQEALTHDVFFAQSLMTATPEQVEVLKALIYAANFLRGNPMDEFQQKVHRGIKLTDRALRRGSTVQCNPSSRFRRVFKVQQEQQHEEQN